MTCGPLPLVCVCRDSLAADFGKALTAHTLGKNDSNTPLLMKQQMEIARWLSGYIKPFL